MAVNLNRTRSYESLGEACCSGEVPSERHEQLAQPVMRNDHSFERVKQMTTNKLNNSSLGQLI